MQTHYLKRSSGRHIKYQVFTPCNISRITIQVNRNLSYSSNRATGTEKSLRTNVYVQLLSYIHTYLTVRECARLVALIAVLVNSPVFWDMTS